MLDIQVHIIQSSPPLVIQLIFPEGSLARPGDQSFCSSSIPFGPNVHASPCSLSTNYTPKTSYIVSFLFLEDDTEYDLQMNNLLAFTTSKFILQIVSTGQLTNLLFDISPFNSYVSPLSLRLYAFFVSLMNAFVYVTHLSTEILRGSWELHHFVITNLSFLSFFYLLINHILNGDII